MELGKKSNGQNGTVTSVAVTESGDALSITGSPITTNGTINIGFAGTSAQYVAGDGSLITFPSLTGYVPYTGATANLDLGTFDLTTDIVNLNQLKAIGSGGLNIYSNSGTHIALMGGGGGAGTTLYGGLIATTASFASNGGSDTFAINHSSGAGIALNITKGGSGEGLYINKTSGSGNAATIIGTLNATTLVKSGGTSSQFLKADGSVDSSTYLTTSAASSTYVPYTGATALVNLGTYNLKANSLYVEGDGAFAGGGILIKQYASGTTSISGYNTISSQTSAFFFSASQGGSYKNFLLDPSGLTNATTRSYTLPDASGTLALTSNLSSYVPYSGATTDVLLGSWALYSAGVQVTNGGLGVISTDGWLSASKGIFLTDTASGGNWSTGITNITARTAGLLITHNAGGGILNFNTSTTYTYNFPAADGTVALTSNLGAYLPLSGGTLTGALNGTSATFTSALTTNGLFTIDQTNGGTILLKTSGSSYGLFANTYNIIGSGSTSDLNAYVYGANSFGIYTNGTKQLTIASTGAATFSNSVMSASGTDRNGGFLINYTSASASSRNWRITTEEVAYGDFAIMQSTSQTSFSSYNYRLYINPSGNVGIGTSSPSYKLDIRGGTSGSSHRMMLAHDYSNAYLQLYTGVDAETGFISNSFVTFYTGSSPAERMRITSGGNVLIGYSSALYSEKFGVKGSAIEDQVAIIQNTSSSEPGGLLVYYPNADPNSDNQSFFIGNANSTVRIFLYNNGGIANYQSNDVDLSDERTKNNIIKLDSYWDKIKNIEIVKYKYNDQTHNDFNIGVIAQQVEEIAPEFVDNNGWKIKDTDEYYKTIYNKDLYFASIKVLQEAMARIEEQQEQIEELKSLINK